MCALVGGPDVGGGRGVRRDAGEPMGGADAVVATKTIWKNQSAPVAASVSSATPPPRSGAGAQGREAGHRGATQPTTRWVTDSTVPHAPGAAGVHAHGRKLHGRCPAMRWKAPRAVAQGKPPRARRRGRTSPGAARAGRGRGGRAAGRKEAGKEGGGGANPCTTRPPAGGSGEEGRGPGPRPLLSTGGRRRSREATTPAPTSLAQRREGGMDLRRNGLDRSPRLRDGHPPPACAAAAPTAGHYRLSGDAVEGAARRGAGQAATSPEAGENVARGCPGGTRPWREGRRSQGGREGGGRRSKPMHDAPPRGGIG